MKNLIVVLSLVLGQLFAGEYEAEASQVSRRPLRYEIERENAQLKLRIDSLLLQIDSLSQRKYLEDSTVRALLAGAKEEESAIVEYSPEVSDSLMSIWMEHRKSNYEFASSCNMDSVRFTSNVPDSEFERRLKAMNPYITIPFNETVKNYMILYSEKMRTWVSEIMGRGVYYMPMIESVLAKYGLPLELKYLAVIESALIPTATSRAGARGLWQFMYSTARAYGLTVNSFVDERLDAEKSMDAAARYLRDSYRIFGDWNLAISSYNCGAGNVQKAIRRAGSSQFWDIYPFLPKETRGYVPAMVGAMYAFTYHREYGIEAAEMGLPAATDTFEIHKNLHFNQIYELVGIPRETLKALNPQYEHEIIPGQSGTCILKIPYNWTPAFVSVDMDSLYNHKSTEYLSAQVLKNIEEAGREKRIAYRVKSGDYLGRIASRNHVTVKQLMKWNHMRNTNLRVGQVLYIYKKS